MRKEDLGRLVMITNGVEKKLLKTYLELTQLQSLLKFFLKLQKKKSLDQESSFLLTEFSEMKP